MAASTGMPPSVDGLIHMLVAARAEMSQLRTRLENQAIIGQAQGIVMERLEMGAPQALAYLA